MRSSARNSIVAGIGGGTAAGKTAIVKGLVGVLGQELVTRIGLDSYYLDRSDLDPIDRREINYDHPDAIDFRTAVRDIVALGEGKSASIPKYDFATHTRAEAEPILPRSIIVVEGILALADEGLRETYDVAVFIDAPADLRLARRLQRDLCERGSDIDESLRRYFDYCRPMHLKYVQPSRAYADVTIAGGGDLASAVKQLQEVVAAAASKKALDRRFKG